MARKYENMTPEEQRVVDERDLEILRLRDTGLSHSAIGRELKISGATVARTLKAIEG